jgi:hypothetical protein
VTSNPPTLDDLAAAVAAFRQMLQDYRAAQADPATVAAQAQSQLTQARAQIQARFTQHQAAIDALGGRVAALEAKLP